MEITKAFKQLALNLGFFAESPKNAIFWGPVGALFKKNIVDSWKKSISTQWEKYDVFEFSLVGQNQTDNEQLSISFFDSIRRSLPFTRQPFCAVAENHYTVKDTTQLLGLNLATQTSYSFFASTTADDIGKDLDFWLRQRKMWWSEQSTSVNDVFDFEISLKSGRTGVNDRVSIVTYKPYDCPAGCATSDFIAEEMRRLSFAGKHNDAYQLVSSTWFADKSALFLLYDSMIYDENRKPVGFRFPRSTAPYKVIIINQCTSNDSSIFKLSALCERLRLSLTSVNVAHLYEIINSSKGHQSVDSVICQRLDFYRSLGLVFAVIVDENSLTGADCPVTVWHADSNIRETTTIVAVRWTILKNLGFRSADEVEIQSKRYS